MIPRKLGYSNLSMLEYCESLRRIVSQKNEITVGRGKAVQRVLVNKYTTDQETLNNIESSCIHYKQLHDLENKKIGSLEVTKYKFDYVNGEPKIIIEMVKVLDENGNYIKFAKLEKVIGFLSNYPITFKELKNE
jgi:hypothetical protein